MRASKVMLMAIVLLVVGAFAQDTQPAVQPAVQGSSTPAATTQPTSAPSAPEPTRVQAAPAQPAAQPVPTTLDQVADRIIERERGVIDFLKSRTPIVETYLQNLQWDPQLGPVPKDDRYFLGRVDLSESIDRTSYLKDDSMEKHMLGGLTKYFKIQYQPLGFSWMLFADRNDFDKQHYEFHYVRREFLGEVRCLVFDITPKNGSGNGRFLGRIWVEDQDFNIVRLNGTYVPRPRNAYFFHMDSWRLNLVPGYWVPAYIYSEEGDFSFGAKNKMAFKAQTRIWGYDLKKSAREDELTQVLVDSSVKDESAAAQDASPVESLRAFQAEAEENVIERLERAGLIAPAGDVDKVLQTVVNNLEITNNIDLPRPVRARVMLTTPLESFSVGNTIVISRGLIDTLPDEASLAMVLSHELAHIVLGHNLGSKYAFNDRMLFSDENTYESLGFRHPPEEETAADKKAEELLKNSPYAQKLDTAGLFLRQLADRAPELTGLLTPHLGNGLAENGTVNRMPEVMNAAPKLDPNKLDQIAALPLGGRVKLNAWNDKVELVKSQAVAITSAREKMPFEVTPFLPRLSRYASGAQAQNQTAAATAPAN